MTTKEKWKAGILICGMLVIAVVVNSRRIDLYLAQSQMTPSYHLAPPQYTPQPAPPAYPIVKWVKINRTTWSEAVTNSIMEKLTATCYEGVPLLVDDGKEYSTDAGNHLDIPGARDHCTRFMIRSDADPSITEAKVKCTITPR